MYSIISITSRPLRWLFPKKFFGDKEMFFRLCEILESLGSRELLDEDAKTLERID
jgi:hypothetical protein